MKQVGAHSSQFKPLQRPMALAKKLVALGAQSNTLAKEQSWKENMAAELDIEIEAPDAPDSGLSFLSHTPATHCNTLQQHATHCNAPTRVSPSLTLKLMFLMPPTLVCLFCHTLQRHTATHCNTLRHTATHCNTLQHTATHQHVFRIV